MLDFADKPYRWFPPRRRAVMAALFGLYNRKMHLPKRKQVFAVHVSGDAPLKDAMRPGDRLLFMPNHPSHADAEVFFDALRQAELTTLIMAAYDVFLRNRVHAWLMQRNGAFSVDREGSDARALKVAKETLVNGRHGLTIFPEGNVYLQNDLVTPFHEGAAMIALRTARELAEKNVRVLAVPVSIKLTYITDVRREAQATLAKLAGMVGVKPGADEPAPQVLRKVGIAALRRNLRHRGIDDVGLDGIDGDDVPALINAAAASVLGRLEAKLGGRPASEDEPPIERVRKARRLIHQIRLDESRIADHAAAVAWADEAMVAFKIASYSGRYVQEKPTLDRFAETVEKLEEDIGSKMPKPLGPREAMVRFNEPVDVTARVVAFEEKARVAVTELTRDVERTVQAGVDAINVANRRPGAMALV